VGVVFFYLQILTKIGYLSVQFPKRDGQSRKTHTIQNPTYSDFDRRLTQGLHKNTTNTIGIKFANKFHLYFYPQSQSIE
jgi:hypothetical protein